VADSQAVRARRARAHRAGDHSQCQPGRCAALADQDQQREPGPVEASVREFMAAVAFPERDPRAALTVMAVRLAGALDRNPGAAPLARELRTIMTWLAENPAGAADRVDELRARRAQRRVSFLLGDRAE
jgi:hypothetical protein